MKITDSTSIQMCAEISLKSSPFRSFSDLDLNVVKVFNPGIQSVSNLQKRDNLNDDGHETKGKRQKMDNSNDREEMERYVRDSRIRINEIAIKRSVDKIIKDHSKNVFINLQYFKEHLRWLIANKRINRNEAITLQFQYIAEHTISRLSEYGWCVIDNFLGTNDCQDVFREVECLFSRGFFDSGQLHDMFPHHSTRIDSRFRSDQIYWFNECIDNWAVGVKRLIAAIDQVVWLFATRLSPTLITRSSTSMISCYPGSGTRYAKHVDNSGEDDRRCITCIYYCNEAWDFTRHGGSLRLYPDSSAVPMDIDPQADRLLFFWSDGRVPHEVLPVYRHRFAITTWFHDERKESPSKKADSEENLNK